jgi:hypothetical protein
LKHLTLTGGDVGQFDSGEGGAIKSTARLVLQDSLVTGNWAAKGGGVWVNVAVDQNDERSAVEALCIVRSMKRVSASIALQ